MAGLVNIALRYALLLAGILLIAFPTLLMSQNEVRTTRVKIKGGRFFFSADTVFFVRNDHLVFDTLELIVGIYPNAPSDQDNVLWNMGGIPTPEFTNFLPRPPGTQIYR